MDYKQWWFDKSEQERRLMTRKYFKNADSEKIHTIHGLMDEEIKEIHGIFSDNLSIVSKYCEGEKCHCGKPSVKKISEVILPDENQIKHELSQYVCQEHFDKALRPYLFKNTEHTLEEYERLISSNQFYQLIKDSSENHKENSIFHNLLIIAKELRNK